MDALLMTKELARPVGKARGTPVKCG